MPGYRGTHHNNQLRPHARPFEEVLLGNPMGNTGNAIVTSGSGGGFGQCPRQYQQYHYQNILLRHSRRFPQTIPQTTIKTQFYCIS